MGSGTNVSIPSFKSTSLSNPYANAYISKTGDASYQLNDFLTGMNGMVEQAVPQLYNQLLNPSLDNPVLQAKMNSFIDELEDESYKQFESNLNALSSRGMLRSSAVNDLANKLNEYQTSEIANYSNQLISDNIDDTTKVINSLLNQYLLGNTLGSSALSGVSDVSSLVNNYSAKNQSTEDNLFATTMKLLPLVAGFVA